MDLLDAVIDRSADILERIGAEVDQVSHEIFEPEVGDATAATRTSSRPSAARATSTSKVRESLVSIGRLLLYLANEADSMRWAKEIACAAARHAARRAVAVRPRRLSVQQDQFLLDAMLGVVSIEQNNIIKIFSVAAVVFMPPTLVASIYGMNFHKHMPELEWDFGYPFALVLMVLAAILPYFFFKWKKWL